MRNGIRAAEQGQGFLAAAPEDAGVAALQSQHPVSLLREADQPGRDVGLAGRGPPAAFSRGFEEGLRPRQVEDARVDERVVDEGVGVAEGVKRQGRQQPRIARPGSDQPDAARQKLRQMKVRAVDHRANLYKLHAGR